MVEGFKVIKTSARLDECSAEMFKGRFDRQQSWA